jgi:hypothetical protein
MGIAKLKKVYGSWGLGIDTQTEYGDIEWLEWLAETTVFDKQVEQIFDLAFWSAHKVFCMGEDI